MRRRFRSVVQAELPEASVHCLFFPPRAPEGAGNYLVACQRAAVIAVCVIRMAAVNMDARASAAVGGQVLVLIKCVSLNHLCVSLQNAHAVKPGQVKGQTTDRVGGLLSEAHHCPAVSTRPSRMCLCPCVRLFVFPNYPLETVTIG